MRCPPRHPLSSAVCFLALLGQEAQAVDFGTFDVDNKWPAVVALAEHLPSLESPSKHEIFCTGVVVHPRVVLTAAHCLQEGARRPSQNELNDRTRSLRLHFGQGAQDGIVETNLITVNKIIIHPEYLRDIRGQSDIAILLLEADAPIDPTLIPPLALNIDLLKNRMNRTKELTLVGFGFSEQEEGSWGQTRQYFGLKHYGKVRIEGKYANEIQIVPGQPIDPLGLFKPAPREGDSGGPSFFQDQDGTYYVAGITSRATRHQRGDYGAALSFIRDSICWIEEESGVTIKKLEADEPDYCAQVAPIHTVQELENIDFVRMCLEPDNISISAAYTIYVLKKLLKKSDCVALNNKLKLTTNLSNIYATYITDLSPLVPFNRIERLIIRDNNISSVAALNFLTRLELVDVTYNNIQDLEKLQEHPNKNLWVYGKNWQYSLLSDTKFLKMCVDLDHQALSAQKTLRALLDVFNLRESDCDVANYELIRLRSLRFTQSRGLTDMSPLEGLITLNELDLRDQSVTNLDFLSKMDDLRILRLDGNPVSDLSPILKHEFLSVLSLRNMNLTEISVLASLRRLRTLDVTGNRINDFSSFERPGRQLQIVGKEKQN